MKKTLFGLMILTFVAMAPSFACAQVAAILDADWGYTNSGATFGANDTVFVMGRIFNLNTSTMNLTSANFSAASSSGQPSPNGTYGSIKFGPGPGSNFWDQFAGMNIAPGGTFDFVHSHYIPSGATPAGVYTTNHNVSFKNVTNTPSGNQQFSWNVGQQSEVIPEPASLSLLGLGLGGFFYRRRKRIV